MPTLGLGGGYTPAFEGNINMLSVVYGTEVISQECLGYSVPNSGYWITEEGPDL